MVIGDTALCHKIEFIDKQDRWREFLCQLKDAVNIFRGLPEILGGDHRESDFKDGHVQGAGHRKGKRCLAGPRGPDKEEFAYLIDPVPVQEFLVLDRVPDLCDEAGLVRRADQVIHSLLHFIRRVDDHKVNCSAQFLIFCNKL